MSTYYVDLDLPLSAFGNGSPYSPYNFSSFSKAISSGGFAADGDVFRLRGGVTITSAFYVSGRDLGDEGLIKNDFLIYSDVNKTFVVSSWNLEKYGPWRMNFVNDGKIYFLYDNLYNGIMYSNSSVYMDLFVTDIYNIYSNVSFLESEHKIAFLPKELTGTCHVNGCCLLNTDAELGYNGSTGSISLDGSFLEYSASVIIKDSICDFNWGFNDKSSLSAYNSLFAQFNSEGKYFDCVSGANWLLSFGGTSYKLYPFSENQIGYNWNTKQLLLNKYLFSSFPATSASLSVGEHDGYSTGLFGNERIGIGAFYFSAGDIYYVDINRTYDSNLLNIGSVNDPFNYSEFKNILNGNSKKNIGSSFKLQGYRELTAVSDLITIKNNRDYIVDVWDASSYGPWVLVVNNDLISVNQKLCLSSCELKNGIIYNKPKMYNNEYYGGVLSIHDCYNMYIVYQGLGGFVEFNTVFSAMDDTSYPLISTLYNEKIYGSTIYSQNGYKLNNGDVNKIDSVFNIDNVEYFGLSGFDVDLTGFVGGFHDKLYGYLVPYNNYGTDFGKLTRFSLHDFTISGVQVLNLISADSDLKGFIDGFSDENYGYLVPFGTSMRLGKVPRFPLNNFKTSAVEVLNLESVDSDLKGFAGGFSDGTHGYLIPYNNGSYQFGKVPRFPLNNFKTSAVEVLNLESVDSSLKGFYGGFSDGNYGYLIPYNNENYFGKVPRFPLNNFKTSAVEVLNLESVDSSLKGFTGGFVDSSYGYLVPYNNGTAFHGKVPRFPLNNFKTSAVDVIDLTSAADNLIGWGGGFFYERYAYFLTREEPYMCRLLLRNYNNNVYVTDSVISNFSQYKTSNKCLSGCDVIVNNSVFNINFNSIYEDFLISSINNSQENWSLPDVYPLRVNNDGYNESLSYLIDNKKIFSPFEGINVPPNPGLNFSGYSNYEYGLFGELRRSYLSGIGHIGSFYLGDNNVLIELSSVSSQYVIFDPSINIVNYSSVSATGFLPVGLYQVITPTVLSYQAISVDFVGKPRIGSSPLTVDFSAIVNFSGPYDYNIVEYRWYWDYERFPNVYETFYTTTATHKYIGYYGKKFDVKLNVILSGRGI